MRIDRTTVKLSAPSDLASAQKPAEALTEGPNDSETRFLWPPTVTLSLLPRPRRSSKNVPNLDRRAKPRPNLTPVGFDSHFVPTPPDAARMRYRRA